MTLPTQCDQQYQDLSNSQHPVAFTAVRGTHQTTHAYDFRATFVIMLQSKYIVHMVDPTGRSKNSKLGISVKPVVVGVRIYDDPILTPPLPLRRPHALTDPAFFPLFQRKKTLSS